MSLKPNEENGGIVYIDVADYSNKLKSYGEYHKNKNRCFGAYRKARIVFINEEKLTPSERGKKGAEARWDNEM